jgi:hypothetical protein
MEAKNTYIQPGYCFPGRDVGKGQEVRGDSRMS